MITASSGWRRPAVERDAIRRRCSPGLHDAFCGGGESGKRRLGAGRARDQQTTAIGAIALERSFRAGRAVGTFEGTDAGFSLRGIEVLVAAFAVGAHFEHGLMLLRIALSTSGPQDKEPSKAVSKEKRRDPNRTAPFLDSQAVSDFSSLSTPGRCRRWPCRAWRRTRHRFAAPSDLRSGRARRRRSCRCSAPASGWLLRGSSRPRVRRPA